MLLGMQQAPQWTGSAQRVETMIDHNDTQSPEHLSQIYQIKLKGKLGEEWVTWFEGLTITYEASGDTLLTGPVVDQAALHGLLKRVRDLGIPLLLVRAMSDESSAG